MFLRGVFAHDAFFLAASPNPYMYAAHVPLRGPLGYTMSRLGQTCFALRFTGDGFKKTPDTLRALLPLLTGKPLLFLCQGGVFLLTNDHWGWKVTENLLRQPKTMLLNMLRQVDPDGYEERLHFLQAMRGAADAEAAEQLLYEALQQLHAVLGLIAVYCFLFSFQKKPNTTTQTKLTIKQLKQVLSTWL